MKRDEGRRKEGSKEGKKEEREGGNIALLMSEK